jgi:DNA-binding NarL/FixJ family response regulator
LGETTDERRFGLTVLVAARENAVRERLRRAAAATRGVGGIAGARNGEEAFELCRTLGPEAVLAEAGLLRRTDEFAVELFRDMKDLEPSPAVVLAAVAGSPGAARDYDPEPRLFRDLAGAESLVDLSLPDADERLAEALRLALNGVRSLFVPMPGGGAK